MSQVAFVGQELFAAAQGGPVNNQSNQNNQGNLPSRVGTVGGSDGASPFQGVSQPSHAPFDANSNAIAPRPAVKTVATRLRRFGIPFRVNADNAAFIEVQLYVSRDRGATWRFLGRQSTDQADFPFEAESDGEYWFALKTLNRDRQLLPPGNPQAELKIVVDSAPPQLDFRIETDAAGRIVCRWRAEDLNLVPETLQILYQPLSMSGVRGDWKRVPVQLSGVARSGIYSDQIAWWPETTEQQLEVAVEIKDAAGNPAQLTRQVNVPQTAWRYRQQSTAQVTDRPAVDALSVASQSAEPQQSANLGFQRAAAPANRREQSAQALGKPDNVVCENGVCRIEPNSQAGLPRTAANRSETVRSLTGTLVDDTAEISESRPRLKRDPFAPNDYLAQLPQFGNQPRAAGMSAAVEWASETERMGPKSQSSQSTTRRPDPTMAPISYSREQSAKPPAENVSAAPANPSQQTVVGNLVVGESSTQGPNNQYRGPSSQQGALPRPSFIGDEQADSRWNQTQSTRSPVAGDHSNGNARTTRETMAPSGREFPGNDPSPNAFSNAAFQPKMTRPTALRSPDNPAADAPRTLPPGIGTAPLTERPNRETKAPVQIIGSKRFRLDYGIDAIDPSGVAKVDLWVTQDDGRSWNAWGSDPDNTSPFPVEIQEQGRYGFRIVVHSKDGLTGQGPSSGDDADMWVLVDTQSPLARITSVPYGRGNEAGRLVINYSVSDNFLTLRPITLSYSAAPNGPWREIAAGLRNEPRYVWKVPAGVPDRIFLRVQAVDKAGNTGEHVLRQAIDVSGLVPRGTIHGVAPVGQ